MRIELISMGLQSSARPTGSTYINSGADGGTRTHRILILSQARIPIPSHPHGSVLLGAFSSGESTFQPF
jgi:hypothetical protein